MSPFLQILETSNVELKELVAYVYSAYNQGVPCKEEEESPYELKQFPRDIKLQTFLRNFWWSSD